MIVRPRPNLLQLFFIIRGSIVLRIFPQIVLVALLSAVVVWLHASRPGLLPSFDGAPFALLGIALSVFLAFRNNACYDRWWEARRHWGELLYISRTLARRTLLLQDANAQAVDVASRQRLLTLTIAFAHAPVVYLRPTTHTAKVLRHLPEDLLADYRASINPPEVLLSAMESEVVALRARASIGDIPFQMLDQAISHMAAVQAACERILTTPVPFGYTLLLHRTAYAFCFLLPFGFADVLGWATPFASALVAYTFFGLDALSDELGDPFGDLPNDLPIDALADTIEINLREAMGEKDLPPLPVAKDYLLM